VILLERFGSSGLKVKGYPRQREYPQPPPPSKNTNNRTINRVDMLYLTEKAGLHCVTVALLPHLLSMIEAVKNV
jgi:hypothetical protein